MACYAVVAVGDVGEGSDRNACTDAAWDLRACVSDAQSGDRAAFAELYRRFHRAVHAVVLARCSTRDASDLVQEVFTQAWAKLDALRDEAAFPGWLLQLARRRAIDHARMPTAALALDDVGVEPPPVMEAHAALQALRELPAAFRETLIMRLVEGLSGPEIAERTGMTPDSVRVNLHRGMKLLRVRLAGWR